MADQSIDHAFEILSRPGGELFDLPSRVRCERMYEESYRRILFSRPLFLDGAVVRSFAEDLAALFRLAADLPRRSFGGDLAAFGHAAGVPDDEAQLMLTDAQLVGEPVVMVRSDALWSDGALRLVELNAGSELGGIEFSDLNAALLGRPAFADFVADHGLGYVDTADHFARLFRQYAGGREGRVTVALTEAPGGVAAHPNFRSVREAFVRRGIDFHLAELQELTLDGDVLMHDGTPVDVVLRFYAAREVLAAGSVEELLAPVRTAVRAGTCRLLVSMGHSLFNSKGALALLQRPDIAADLSPDERGLVSRLLPHTWLVDEGTVTVDDERTTVPDLAVRRQAELVLKPCVGWGAQDVVMGWEVSPQEWRQRVEAATNRHFVLQERVHPQCERAWSSEAPEPRLEDWVANFGVFVTELGYAGTFARLLRPSDGSAVAFGNPGTRGTTVFETEA